MESYDQSSAQECVHYIEDMLRRFGQIQFKVDLDKCIVTYNIPESYSDGTTFADFSRSYKIFNDDDGLNLKCVTFEKCMCVYIVVDKVDALGLIVQNTATCPTCNKRTAKAIRCLTDKRSTADEIAYLVVPPPLLCKHTDTNYEHSVDSKLSEFFDPDLFDSYLFDSM